MQMSLCVHACIQVSCSAVEILAVVLQGRLTWASMWEALLGSCSLVPCRFSRLNSANAPPAPRGQSWSRCGGIVPQMARTSHRCCDVGLCRKHQLTLSIVIGEEYDRSILLVRLCKHDTCWIVTGLCSRCNCLVAELGVHAQGRVERAHNVLLEPLVQDLYPLHEQLAR